MIEARASLSGNRIFFKLSREAVTCSNLVTNTLVLATIEAISCYSGFVTLMLIPFLNALVSVVAEVGT